jgi:hypothetical protein
LYKWSSSGWCQVLQENIQFAYINKRFKCLSHKIPIKTKQKICGKVVSVLNQLSTMPWRHIGEWRYSSTIPELGTRWRWVVSYTPPPLYTRGVISPGTHLIGDWVGPIVGLGADTRKILPCWESNPGRPARSPSLHRLLTNPQNKNSTTIVMSTVVIRWGCGHLDTRCPYSAAIPPHGVSTASLPGSREAKRSAYILRRDGHSPPKHLGSPQPLTEWSTRG